MDDQKPNKAPKTFKDVADMKRGRRAYLTFNFPFQKDVQLAIRLLTDTEVMKCETKGANLAREMLKTPTPQHVENAATYCLLYEACYAVPELGEDILSCSKFFESVEQIGDLTLDEKNMLLEHYNLVQERFAKFDDFTSPEQFSELLEEVKKNSPRGMSFSSFTLRKLLLFSVNPDLATSQMDSGLPTSPSNSSEPKPSETPSNEPPPKNLKAGFKLDSDKSAK